MTPIDWIMIVSGVVYSGLEYWLGKTDKVKSNSTIELLVKATSTVAKILLKKKP